MSIEIPSNAKKHFNEAVAEFQDRFVHHQGQGGPSFKDIIAKLQAAVREYPKFSKRGACWARCISEPSRRFRATWP